MTRRVIIALAAFSCLLSLGACRAGGDDSGDAATAYQPPPVALEPEVAGIPEVVAAVNGEAIGREAFIAQYRIEFAEHVEAAPSTGGDSDQSLWQARTLEAMIDRELLFQEATRRHYTAEYAQVQRHLERTARAQNLASVEELLRGYAELGVSERTVRDNAERSIVIDAFVAGQLAVAEPTDAEVAELYESMGYTEVTGDVEVPTLAEIRPELRRQLHAQRREAAIAEHVASLRDRAEVDTFIDGRETPDSDDPQAPDDPERSPETEEPQPHDEQYDDDRPQPSDPSDERDDGDRSPAPAEPSDDGAQPGDDGARQDRAQQDDGARQDRAQQDDGARQDRAQQDDEAQPADDGRSGDEAHLGDEARPGDAPCPAHAPAAQSPTRPDPVSCDSAADYPGTTPFDDQPR